MKFLCVECDEAMGLRETRGPDNGSMTVVFGCPSCGRQTAMLTNAMETQVVRSLGVKIGGRDVPAEPLEMLRSSLKGSGSHGAVASKCPFTGLVEDSFQQSRITWNAAARSRAERIPEFARDMAMKSVEDYARQKGYTEITEGVMDEVRLGFGF